MLEVKFYDTVDDALLKFAVIISKSKGKWVLCKHKERDTYEVSGGHREAGADLYLTGINPNDNSIHQAKPCLICARTIIQAG